VLRPPVSSKARYCYSWSNTVYGIFGKAREKYHLGGGKDEIHHNFLIKMLLLRLPMYVRLSKRVQGQKRI
jgi:hypothetical protein